MKRLFGASETMEEAVMAKNGGKLAELVKDCSCSVVISRSNHIEII